jgi:hypothetical protein
VTTPATTVVVGTKVTMVATRATIMEDKDIIDSNITITTTNTIITMTKITIITVEMITTEDTEVVGIMIIRIKITKPMIVDLELEVNIIRIRIISIITSKTITHEKEVDIKMTITLEIEAFKIRRTKNLMKIIEWIILNQ